MREIKFRGKRVDTKEWIYGGYYKWGDKSYIIQKDIWDKDINTAQMIEVIPETVGQYTGLKDKNGVEIYEGDIYHQGDKGILYVVEYTQDCSFMGRQIKTRGSRAGLAYWQDRIEVIGNIYENPELLEASNGERT